MVSLSFLLVSLYNRPSLNTGILQKDHRGPRAQLLQEIKPQQHEKSALPQSPEPKRPPSRRGSGPRAWVARLLAASSHPVPELFRSFECLVVVSV